MKELWLRPTMSSSAVHSRISRRCEAAIVAVLAVVFASFTWRCVTMFFGDDDMLNMYYAWTTPALKIWKAQIIPWMPLPRPLGTAVYRVSYSLFGFHPLPLYIFCWLLLIGNVFIAWRFYRATAPSIYVGLLALSLTLVHGSFQDLYLNAGTLYDGLCFLFTALAVITYARTRRDGSEIRLSSGVLLCFFCLMAMDSKESGAIVPALLFCYECLYCLPAFRRSHGIRKWIRSIAPLYLALAILVAAFVFGRVRRTDVLVNTPAYHPHFSFHFWLSNVAGYLNILSYRYLHFGAIGAAIALVAAFAVAAFLRNRAMLFGWLFFVIGITPVALISPRLGYVLYVPELGLGLYLAALIGLVTSPLFRSHSGENAGLNFRQVAGLVVFATMVIWVDAAHWPAPWRVQDLPEWRVADKMRRDYPDMKPAAKVLFVDDYPSDNGYDLMFNLRLLYHDPQIEVARLKGDAGQRPERPLTEFDHIFTTGMGTYVELDRHNVEESIRLNILRDYLPGRYFDSARADHAGYVVSGLLDWAPHSGAGCWTTRSTRLKFDVYPADSKLALRFWVPDYVADKGSRHLSLAVDDVPVGTIPLTHIGENRVEFEVPGRAINASGFTILQLNVDDPYTKDGQEYGVVLLQAGFDYVNTGRSR